MINSRDQLKEYCLRRLGWPVINIEVDSDTLEDRIDDALQQYWNFHNEGVEQSYYVYPNVTQDDINNRYITLSDDITSVVRIFNFQNTIANQNNIFDLRYQLYLQNIWDFSNASFVNYETTMMHLRNLELLFTGEVPFTFTKNNSRLNIQWGWGSSECVLGSHIVIECFRIIDPNLYPKTYNDNWLKAYTTALFKKQWASSLQKFQNISLPGGVQLNASYLMQQSEDEILKLEDELITKYSAPLDFYTG